MEKVGPGAVCALAILPLSKTCNHYTTTLTQSHSLEQYGSKQKRPALVGGELTLDKKNLNFQIEAQFQWGLYLILASYEESLGVLHSHQEEGQMHAEGQRARPCGRTCVSGTLGQCQDVGAQCHYLLSTVRMSTICFRRLTSNIGCYPRSTLFVWVLFQQVR